jgi:ATP-dependent helicase HrpB
MRSFDTPLPIDDVLGTLAGTLRKSNAAVLVAPPGAGKTTRVPLALLDEPWLAGRKIVVLEPRRIAARASADPELSGVAAVLFDEFHERSLDADLGLALARDAQTGLREDLRILVMSATLDGARVARLLGDAAVVESEGRMFPVDTRYVGRKSDAPLERQMAETIAMALRAEVGSVLAFLPGAAEIRRTETMLRERVNDPSVEIVALLGALDASVQDRAIAPAPKGTRKVVLATSIAETSLTIEGVRIVVDCGLSRVPRYEPDIALTRLETVRASRAAVDQRRGRAGRIEPGVCYRLWDEPQTNSLEAFTQPEILASDLSSLVLDLAQWGVSEPSQLAFLDPPPAPAWNEAKALLRELEALDGDGRITAEGKSLRALPLPPRLARMIVDAGREGHAREAAQIAAVLSERGLGGDDVDLDARLDRFGRDRGQRASAARQQAEGWVRQLGEKSSAATADLSTGVLLSLAFPDRVARNRGNGSFVLANGRGASVEQTSALARVPYLAVGELTGTAANGRILLAAPITLAEIERRFAHEIEGEDEIVFDAASMSLRGRRKRKLHAVTLGEQTMQLQPNAETAHVFADGLAQAGLGRLPWSKALQQWRDRVMFLRKAEGDAWPDLSDAALATERAAWLEPMLHDKTSLGQISAADLSDAVMGLLVWDLRARLDREAPTHFEAPTGSQVAIDYEAEQGPTIAIRVQELFGLNAHPSIAQGKIPLVVELLSPAHRPVQVTRDLPGFWRGSYAAVRTDLRGRYPRHPWPDDPANAMPTRRAKPRGT